jgi:Fe-S-cluster containining protein
MACRRCGMCCARPSIVIESWELDDNGRQMAEFWAMHHVEVKIVPGVKGVVMQFPLTCENLDYDDEEGVAICRIYENRPKICREYLCPAAQEEKSDVQA